MPGPRLCGLCALCGERSLPSSPERPFTTEHTETTEAGAGIERSSDGREVSRIVKCAVAKPHPERHGTRTLVESGHSRGETTMIRKTVPVLFLILLGGCTLYSEVDVTPLILQPSNIERGADLASMLRKADYLRAMEMANVLDARDRKNAADLAALGSAYLAAGRYDDARGRLRAALDLDPFRTTYAQIAWDLSQVEYLSNNFESSLDWAT